MFTVILLQTELLKAWQKRLKLRPQKSAQLVSFLSYIFNQMVESNQRMWRTKWIQDQKSLISHVEGTLEQLRQPTGAVTYLMSYMILFALIKILLKLLTSFGTRTSAASFFQAQLTRLCREIVYMHLWKVISFDCSCHIKLFHYRYSKPLGSSVLDRWT